MQVSEILFICIRVMQKVQCDAIHDCEKKKDPVLKKKPEDLNIKGFDMNAFTVFVP